MIDKAVFGDYQTAWCPGCGNFGILAAVKEALATLDLKPQDICYVSGIGQAAKLPQYLNCNFFNGLHGRALPVATGIKIANKNLVVMVNSGDGDIYGEGGNHFIHAIRRNIDITVIVHNNQVYGLTKGQASPTSDLGFVTKVQPDGVIDAPVHPLTLAIALEAGYVARSFSGDKEHLSSMICEGIRHKGFSLIDCLQPCVTFNKKNNFAWYRDRIYKIPSTHNIHDKSEAFKMSLEWGQKIPVGVFYQNGRPAYTDVARALPEKALVDLESDVSRLESLFEKFY